MRRHKIIHLDDHKLVTDCIRDFVLSDVSNCDFMSFNDTNDAFNYIVNLINNNEIIDVFITDFAHPGMNGYVLSKSIRELENKMNRKPMKILLLTMFSNTFPEISRGLEQKIFSGYLSLSTSKEQIINFVKSDLIAY
jgi:DNA-binding NarL/FixJ family response regulator